MPTRAAAKAPLPVLAVAGVVWGMIRTRCSEGVERPVGKIVCVGRNYGAHAREMGVDRPPEPLLFLKPSTALLPGGGEVRLPSWSRDVHHEVELVVRIGTGARDLDAAAAGRCVDAVAVGIDLTARDVQARAKSEGAPWAVAKGFDGSAPVGPFAAAGSLAPLADGQLRLWVDGRLRQEGRLSGMIWSVPELIAFISTRFTLEPGDLVFAGTPEGVGPVRRGERVRAVLEGYSEVEIVAV